VSGCHGIRSRAADTCCCCAACLQYPKQHADSQAALLKHQARLAGLKQQEAEEGREMQRITSEAEGFAGTVASMRDEERGLKGRLAAARKHVQEHTNRLEEAQVGDGQGGLLTMHASSAGE
jgi:hypothetical protein